MPINGVVYKQYTYVAKSDPNIDVAKSRVLSTLRERPFKPQIRA